MFIEFSYEKHGFILDTDLDFFGIMCILRSIFKKGNEILNLTGSTISHCNVLMK